jgi:uncharacterized membrane-anchored protein
MNTEKLLNKTIKQWHFFIPLLLQTALILATPAQSFYIYTTGKTVILQTQPVDPYDLLRGYSQTLSYDVSQISNLSKLEGWETIKDKATVYSEDNIYLQDNLIVYVTLEAPNDNNSKPPLPWKPLAVSLTHPQEVKPNQIILTGVTNYSTVIYGLETYYFPESQREEINNKINTLQSQNNQNFVVEIKVDKQGKAVPVSLWIEDENYRF